MKVTRDLMMLIHGSINLEILTETEVKNIYLVNGQALFEKCYYNGFDFIELNPITEPMFLSGEFAEKTNNFQDACLNLAKENKWVDLFGRIDKKLGIQVYIREFENIPDDQKYDAFIEIYVRSEFGFELLKDTYSKVFEYKDFSNQRLERLAELHRLKKNRKFTIFHGASYDKPVYDFYSWTLNEMKALWFAYRYSNFGTVLKRKIKFEDAIDYLTSRGEEEILYAPKENLLELLYKEDVN